MRRMSFSVRQDFEGRHCYVIYLTPPRDLSPERIALSCIPVNSTIDFCIL